MINLTIDEFVNYIELLGYIPACPTICVPIINKLNKEGVYELKFFINKHNLCWFADKSWLDYQEKHNKEILGDLITLNIRDFKLASLGIT